MNPAASSNAGEGWPAYARAFGSELRAARRAAGLSTEAAADIAGLHPNTVSGAELGRVNLSLVSVARLMAALGSPGFSLGDDGFALTHGPAPLRAVIDLPASAIVAMTGFTVRQERQRLGATLDELAARAGIHRNSLWNLETGLVVPTAYGLFRVHRALGIIALAGTATGLEVVERDACRS